MSAEALQGDRVGYVLDARLAPDLRFRSAMITSTALHTVALLLLLLAPLLIPKPVLFEFTPVNLVSVQGPEPAPAPPPEVEPEPAQEETPPPEPEPEPEPEPVDVPEDLEAQRQREAEEEARRRAEEEAERRRQEEARRAAEEEARRRREEEEERRRREEEERRRAPQTASRSRPQAEPQDQLTQQAARGQVGLSLSDEGARLTEEDFAFQYWLDRLLTNIANKWDPPARPAGSREIRAVVHFRVDRNGRVIVGPEVRTRSGVNTFDAAATRAIAAGQPFPPLPQAYRGSTLGINLAFIQ